MIEIEYCGRCDYRPMWEKQQRYFNNLIEQVRNKEEYPSEHLLIVEHNPVYTLGKHGKEENLLADQARLRNAGAECIRIERGGDITFHGPGQLVLYPIISLAEYSLGVKDYVNLLEETIIQFLAEYNIKGERVEGATGVWLDKGTPRERKICAIGVKCSHFVTMHGLALNVNTDLNYFSLINPCGFQDKGVTSMEKELGQKIDFEGAAIRVADILCNLLNKQACRHR
ncbi:MAG: lipoyl(octanoyl) transferase LipB [Bacteroidales bacterium]|nr:lipoyl(octanoyl) transferase LipB [Bacteroidales bacterium]MBD5221376.1 lipoyl(octanoyl) transferase LipB [Bacteroidales bacterium]